MNASRLSVGSLLAALALATLHHHGDAADAAGGPVELAPRLTLGAMVSVPRGNTFCQRRPTAVYDAKSGQYLLAWQDGFNGQGGASRVLAQRLDGQGRPREAVPFPICPAEGVQDSPAAACCAGRTLVTWADMRTGDDYDIRAAFVAADGTVEPKGGFLVAGGPGSQCAPAVASDGAGQFLVVWQGFADDRFSIWAARVAAASGEVLDTNGFRVMERGESPAVAWNGTNYVVSEKWNCAVVGSAGKVEVAARQLWDVRPEWHPINWGVRHTAATAAWGKAYVFFNTSPTPDPWGWRGCGAVIGVSVASDGKSPEWQAAAPLKDAKVALAAGLVRESTQSPTFAFQGLHSGCADGYIPNCVAATRWLNHPGWPMGIHGGFKHSHDDQWITGRPAATFNGQSLLCAWASARLVVGDNFRTANHDLWLARMGPDWGLIDSPPLRIPYASSPVEESNPMLASGPAGQALLAWECGADRGVGIHYCTVTEQPDAAAPRVTRVVPKSDTEWVVVFDEPLDVASVSAGSRVAIDGAVIRKVLPSPDPRGRSRDVVLETDPLERGKRYTLHVDGIRDRFGNATAGAAFEFMAQPGLLQHGEFIDRWAVVGPFPADVEKHPFDPTAVRPAADGEPRWQDVPGPVLDIGKLYGEKSGVMAYATVWAHADRPRDARLRLDTSDFTRVWLNGEVVRDGFAGLRAGSQRGFHDGTDEAVIRLREGWNRLLIQIDNRGGQWLLVGQLVDGSGATLRDVTLQTAAPKAD